MGHLWTRLFKHKDVRILLLGLDSGGKTTILYRLKLDEVVTTVPTIGFNVESIQYRDLHFTAWDIGSRDKIRPLFRHYYKGADAVVFVVDSHDPERLDELNYDVIKPAMNAEELKEAVFLFLANKVDLSHTISVEEIAERLGLQYLKHTWNILPVSAVTGEGLYTALDWLSMKLGSIQARRALEAPPSPASTNSPAVNVDCVEPTSTLHSTSGKTGPNTGDRSCKTGPNTGDRSCKTGPNTDDRSCKTGPNTDDRSCKTGLSPRSSVQGGTETASASGPDNVELQVRGDYCARAYSAIKCFFFRSNRQGRQASPDTISTSSQD